MRKTIDRIKHRNDSTYQFYEFLKESRCWTQEQHQTYQLRKISELWAFASVHVPYYKQIAERLSLTHINNWDDFRRIPILTKDIVRNNFENMQADNLPRSRFIKNSTSGSTGSNFWFFCDSKQIPINNAYTMFRYDLMGLDYFDARKMSVWGSSFDSNRATKGLKSRFNLWLKNLVVVSEYELSDTKMKAIIDTIVRKKPKALQSYPSIFMHIAQYIEKQGLDIHIPVLYTGGEKLFEYQRQAVEKAFHGHLFDFYGARDMPFIGMSCELNKAIHVFQENVVFEVLDTDRNILYDGEGDIILTSLHNYAMPFIRYQIGDQAKVHVCDSECSCGCHYQLVDEIIGRKFDIIKFPNGNSVGGTFWTLLMRAKSGVDDFQVIQPKPDKIVINYVSNDNLDNDFKQFIISEVQHKGGTNVCVDFCKVERISVTKAGKKQFVIAYKES